MTKRDFIEQKRLTDPMWYAQHVVFNANGEMVDPSAEPAPAPARPNAEDCAAKIIDLADRYFKVGVLVCLVVMTIAVVVISKRK